MTDSIFPTVSSLLDPKALAEQALSAYYLPAPVSCRLAARGLNDTYRVETGAGRVFLRVYRHGWRSDAETAAELALMTDLHAAGLPVAQPVKRSDGAVLGWVVAAEGRRQVALFTQAVGEDVREITTKHSMAYGRLAGRLHDAVDRSGATYERFQLDERHLIDAPLAAIRERMGDEPACADDLAYLGEVAERVRGRIALLPRDRPAFGLCHGDLHPGNVRFAGDDLPTLFDFDCCGYGWRAYDLAVFLWNSYLERRTDSWRAARWKAFLRGYESVRPLEPGELDAAPLFLVARHIWLMGLDVQGQSDWLPQWLTPEWFGTMVGHVRRWVDEYQALSLAQLQSR